MTYWIGGSPCAGKSSIAALLAARHGLRLFSCDAELPPRIPDLRTAERLALPPGEQCTREIEYYHARFPLLRSLLPLPVPPVSDPGSPASSVSAVPSALPAALPASVTAPLLVEGADLLPPLLTDVPRSRAVWIVPTPAFQWEHYAARPWVESYLAGCPPSAFSSWMERDILFGRYVRTTATGTGGTVIEVDGSRTVAETTALVERHLGLVLS